MNTLPLIFSLRDKKSILGFFLGVFTFAVFTFFYGAIKYGAVFFLLFAIAGCLRISFRNRTFNCALAFLLTCCIAAVLVLFPYYEVLNIHMRSMLRLFAQPHAFLLNGMLIASSMAVVYALTGRWRLSAILPAVAFSMLAIINGYIFRFRGTELIFPDIFSFRTAMNVAGQYNLQLQQHTFLSVTGVALLLFGTFCLPPSPEKLSIKRRLIPFLAGILLFVGFSWSAKLVKITTWSWDGTLLNGYYLNFYISMRDYFIREPDTYSEERIRQLEQQYAGDTTAAIEDLPNILVIMNESFADLRVFGTDLQTNQAVTPFWDSLKENAIKGHALTSVYAGTTANAEFEFLTGFSTQFLPSGAIPYQQHIHSNCPALPWVLAELGYETLATHPYESNGWNRPAVYPRLGFERSTFLEAYPQEDLLRGYVSDREMYGCILDQLQNSGDSPLFLFGITMQNHGGYGESPEVEEKISLEGYVGDYPAAEVYLTLLHQSDLALEFLLTELETFPEKTIVLFFGDHLPAIESEFYEELHPEGFSALDSRMTQYTVPFLIWANYDIPGQTLQTTSLSYLSRHLLENAGIALPPYYRFLKAMEQEIPAINQMGYYSKQAKRYLPTDQAAGAERSWLDTYEILQYNGLIRETGKSPVFFAIHG